MTKAITLHQPWASLIALGVKTIETRSWKPPAALIGKRLLIHAGTRPLPVGGVKCPPTYKRDGTRAEQEAVNHQTWHAINTITDPAFRGPQPCNPKTGRQRRIPKRAQTPTLMWPHAGPWHRPREGKPEFTHIEYLPLGAIVASCVLADAVPMRDVAHSPRHMTHVRVDPGQPLTLHRWECDGRGWLAEEDIEAQRSYGDFAPGRWAWLLDDVKPTTERCPACWGTGWVCDQHRRGACNECHDLGSSLGGCPICTPAGGYDGSGRSEPIPAKGHQRMWEWTL